MKAFRLIIMVCLLSATGHSQGSPDVFIDSLHMPCYPPLARQAKVEGRATVKIQTDNDGAVTSAEAVEGNPLLKNASLANVRTWKFAAWLGQSLSGVKTTVIFEYKLEGEPGFDRCAARVIFDSFNKVEIIAQPPVPMTNYSPDRQPSATQQKE